MCLMLYLGSRRPLPLRESESLSLEVISQEAQVVGQYLDRPYAYYVGSHTGCGCGFPHVLAETPIEYFDGMFDNQDPNRVEDVESARHLMDVIDEALDGQPDCVLLPVWNGNEGVAPKGNVVWKRHDLAEHQFVFTEQFRYCVTR